MEDTQPRTNFNMFNHNRLHVYAPVFIIGTGFLTLVAAVFLAVYWWTSPSDFMHLAHSVVDNTWFAIEILFWAFIGGAIVFLTIKLIKELAPLFSSVKVHHANDNYVIYSGADAKVHDHSNDKHITHVKEIAPPPGQLQLPPPVNVAQPTQEYAISQLRENALQVCLGASTTTQQPYVINLLDGVHYRFIGSSGMGKSCLAGSVLDQVTQTNDEHHLQIALLDSEYKTSRLFEHLPHVAELQVGRKRVECVATSAEEVAEHIGYLRMELDRRKELSELDLQRERFMLIYIEEFLSLKREIPKELRMQFLRDFSILALRGRKYKLYLLACAQVDYASKASGEEAELLREAQSQFSVNASFAVKPTAARAAGFTSNDLIEQNFNLKRKGQMVLETTGVSDIMLAPRFDVVEKLIALERSQRGANPGVNQVLDDDQHQNIVDSHLVNTEVTPTLAPALEAKLPQVADMLARHYNQTEIIEKVWQCSKGTNAKYYQARAEYLQLVNMIRQRQAQTIELGA